MSTSVVSSSAQAQSAASSTTVAIFAMLLGAVILFGVGFAHPAEIHNAAHDARHAFSFPCH